MALLFAKLLDTYISLIMIIVESSLLDIFFQSNKIKPNPIFPLK